MEVTIIRKVELSMDEQKKYEVIKSLADHPAPNKQRAALTLGCTVRHINRMLKGYKEHGKAYFIHGNRGRKPANTIPNETRNLVVDLYRNKYYDANFVHFTELLGKHEDIHISPSAVVSRLIEGEYFRIDQMLSSDYETKIQVNKKELLDCIDRATLLVKESDKKPIILSITDDNIELKIQSQIGSMDEEIDINKEGKDIMIGFNPRFLIDALRVIDDETVDIYLMNPKAPCFIRDEQQSYIYLILPVNFMA